MKLILCFLLMAFGAYAQTTDITFSIDSVDTDRWYFTTTNTTTLDGGDKSIQGYQRFFDKKDSVLAYADRVLLAVKVDSSLATKNLVLADSAKYRIGRAIFEWNNSFSGPKSALRPPTTKTEPAQTKAIKPKTKRVKNLKSKQ